MLKLRPHAELGGNEILSLVREADNLDKHRLMIPSIDYTQIDGPQWLAAFPDSPIQIGTGTGLTLGLSSTTFNWTDHNVPPNMLGSLMFGTLHIYEREINLRLDIVFQIGQLGRIYPMIATLNQMIDSVRETVRLMREGAVSS